MRDRWLRLALALLLVWGGVPYVPEPLLPAVTLHAAQGTVETQHFVVADTNDEVFTMANIDAGNALVLVFVKTITSNRSMTFSTDTGDSFSMIEGEGDCTTTQCVEVWIDYSVVGGNPVQVTADLSSTGVGYAVWAAEINCPNTCQSDTSSSLNNPSAVTTHPTSADASVIDTAADAVVFNVCRANNNTMGDTPPTGWEEITESPDASTQIFGAFEDDQATAFTDERGIWSTSASVTSLCVIASVKDSGGGAPPSSSRLLLLGVGE